jgi:hypothetical protein
MEYIWGPLSDADISSLKERYQADLMPRLSSSHKPKTPDKVEMRQLAAAIGIIAQPEFHDLSVLPKVTGLHELHFAHIDFSALPIDELFNGGLEEVIFEDIDAGFILRRQESGVRLFTRNPSLLKELESLDAPEYWGHDELQRFLTSVTAGDFAVTHLSLGNSHLTAQPILDLLKTLPDGGWYLKDSSGSRGYHVVKLELRDGNIVDLRAPATAERLFAEAGNDTQNVDPAVALALIVGSVFGRRALISNALLEKEIPTEVVGGVRAEPRALFAFSGGEPSYLCGYSKRTAADSISVNIAQGGEGEAYRTTFSNIIRHYTGLEGEALEVATETAVRRFKQQSSEFASAYINLARTKDYRYGPLFAVDLAPVWNKETSEIEFVLMEVQPEPMTSGALGVLPADEQAQVDLFNERMAKLEELEARC